MSTNRFAGRRLRLESLEGREVPAAIAGSDPTASDPTVTTQTSTDASSADPVAVINTGGTNTTTTTTTETVTTTSAADNTPQDPTVDLGLSMAVDKTKPSVGDVVTLKVTLVNNGTVDSTNAAAAVTLPAGLTFVSSDAGTNFDSATGTWTSGTLASQATAVLTIKAKVTDPAAQSVTASITHADQTDDKADNNSASLSVTPVLAKLNLMKSMSATTVSVGSTVLMTVAVGNGGPGRGRDVVVTDTLGDGLTFVKALSATQGNYNPTTHTWTVGTVAPGTIAVLRVLVLVNKIGRVETPSAMTATGYDTTLSKLDATVAVTGVKPSPATWAFYGGPGFAITPGPVPVAAKGVTPWAGSIVNNQFLMTHGFALNGFKLV